MCSLPIFFFTCFLVTSSLARLETEDLKPRPLSVKSRVENRNLETDNPYYDLANGPISIVHRKDDLAGKHEAGVILGGPGGGKSQPSSGNVNLLPNPGAQWDNRLSHNWGKTLDNWNNGVGHSSGTTLGYNWVHPRGQNVANQISQNSKPRVPQNLNNQLGYNRKNQLGHNFKNQLGYNYGNQLNHPSFCNRMHPNFANHLGNGKYYAVCANSKENVFRSNLCRSDDVEPEESARYLTDQNMIPSSESGILWGRLRQPLPKSWGQYPGLRDQEITPPYEESGPENQPIIYGVTPEGQQCICSR